MSLLMIFIFAGLIALYASIFSWLIYKTRGLKSNYYISSGAFFFSLTSFIYAVTLVINKTNINLDNTLFLVIFMIIPGIIFNIGFAMDTILYKKFRLSFKDRLNYIIFRVPKGITQIEEVHYRKDLLIYALFGYLFSLIMSLIYTPKDFLIIILAVTSEAFILVAPLNFANKNAQKTNES